MFTEPLFITAKAFALFVHANVHQRLKQINKFWSINTVKYYYSATKKELLTHIPSWINL